MDRSTNKILDNQQSKLFIFFIQHRLRYLHQRYLVEETGLRRMMPCRVCPASCFFTNVNLDAKPLCIMLQRSGPGQPAGPQR